jgi:putative CocE/NonD family hydrolase
LLRPICLLLLLCACGLPYHVVRSHYDLPAFTSDATDWREVKLPMRDGVKLMTRILMPEGVDHAPVMLIRNPYQLLPTALRVECGVYARYGIGCVIQDVRGRLDSEGDWEPLVHEGEDGADTLQWLQEQSWCDSIALSGVSYLAGAVLASGAKYPPKVKAAVISVFGVKLHDVTQPRGLFPHELLTAWAAYMPSRQALSDPTAAYRSALVARPHIDADEKAFGRRIDYYRRWLRGASPDDPLWTNEKSRAFEAVPEQIHIPILYIEGLDDPFLPAGLDTFARLGSRDRSTLLLLPMNHTGSQLGDLTSEVDTRGISTWTYPVPWLLHHLKGAPLPFEVGVVKSWAHGDGPDPVVRKEWPGPTQAETLWLDGKPALERPCPQRTLSSSAGAVDALKYRYDPKKPWLSEGGARGLAYVIVDGVTPGPVLQTWDCRDDVLRFVGQAAPAQKRLIGKMKLELDVRSSAPDTAFVAKLVDIDERHRAVHITDAVATLHWPNDAVRLPQPYTPGDTRRLELDFFPTEWVLKKGHRLGLWVSSSSFPMFSLHLNTEAPWYEVSEPHTADQQVLLGTSQLTLQLAR